jgi:predicted nucleic-acid-binding protein
MIGLDTNVLLRFFAQDDERQSKLADEMMASLTRDNPGWIGLATVLEFMWAMSKPMRLPKPVVCNALDQLLSINSIVVDQSNVVALALRQFRATHADFADCLISLSARAAGCSKTVTFDKIAARDAGMELLA